MDVHGWSCFVMAGHGWLWLVMAGHGWSWPVGSAASWLRSQGLYGRHEPSLEAWIPLSVG